MVRADWLALDLRALAVFRISLAMLSIIDLLSSLGGVGEFYSDHGILPRQQLELPASSGWFCAFMGSGQPWIQAIWIGVALLCAIHLLLGKQSRLMTFWVWFFLASLHLRNHFAGDRGGMELEIMLFWSFFLPVEARWSLAARNHPGWIRLNNCFRSLGTVALILQFSLIYLFTAALKWGPAWVLHFDAALISCRSGQVSTAYSEWLAGFPGLLQAATCGTLLVEALLPFLLLCPIAQCRLRVLAVLMLTLFHGHNWFCFRLGYFPLMNVVLSWVLLPTACWDWLLNGKSGGPQTVAELPPAYALSRLSQAWLVVCLLYCGYCNLLRCPRPGKEIVLEPWRSFGKFTRLEQQWDLFSPNPPSDLWFRLLAVDSNGKEVDLFRNDRRVTLERPVSPMSEAPSHLWQMVLLNSAYQDDVRLRRSIPEYWERHYQGRYHNFRYQLLERDYNSAGQPLAPQLELLWPKAQARNLLP